MSYFECYQTVNILLEEIQFSQSSKDKEMRISGTQIKFNFIFLFKLTKLAGK